MCWVDGGLVPIDEPALRADDSAFALGRGCYTTSRYRDGRIWFASYHAARLVRDARRLGIGELDEAVITDALLACGRENFGGAGASGGDGTGDGVVRAQASRDGDGTVHLTIVPRSPGNEPSSWRACTAPMVHEGPMPWSGAKVSNHLLFLLAGEYAHAMDCEEALLLDRDGYLIEGSRSNLLIVDPRGEITTPDLARGGVAGVGLEVLQGRVPQIALRNISGKAAGSTLSNASELIAVNAIRGPKPIVSLDGRDVGEGRPGPVSVRLAASFDEAVSALT